MSNAAAKQTATTGNWANRGKAATAAIPVTIKKPSDYTDVRKGVVESFGTHLSAATGGLCTKTVYTVEGQEGKLYEYNLLRKPNANGDMEKTKYGEQTLKMRLRAFGLDNGEVNAFPIPKTINDQHEAYDQLVGTPVLLALVDEEYMGKTQKKVKAVFPLEG